MICIGLPRPLTSFLFLYSGIFSSGARVRPLAPLGNLGIHRAPFDPEEKSSLQPGPFLFRGEIYPGTKLWQIALDEGFIHNRCNPLMPLWYLSRELDLDVTMRQSSRAACRWPEIALGDVERFLPLTKLLGISGKICFYTQAQLATSARSPSPSHQVKVTPPVSTHWRSSPAAPVLATPDVLPEKYRPSE